MKPPFACLLAAAALSSSPAWAQPAATPPPLPAAETRIDAPEGPALETPWPLSETRARASAAPWSRIEQVRRGNRIVEIRITDAAGETRYTMVNREGQPPRSAQELSSGLSTPRFFSIDF